MITAVVLLIISQSSDRAFVKSGCKII